MAPVRLLVIGFVVAGWLAWPIAQEIPTFELHQITLGIHDNGSPVPCDRTWRSQAWQTSHTIQIAKVENWIGTGGGNPGTPGGDIAPVDVHSTLHASRGRIVSSYGVDHYTMFTAPHTQVDVFPWPYTFTLYSGEWLNFQHFCGAISVVPAVSHASVLVWFRRM